MKMHLDLKENGYDIVIEKGCLKKASDLLDLNRKVLIVTDSGVPSEYAETAASLSSDPVIKVIEQGEKSKALTVFEELLKTMLSNSFTRKDAVIALGGGVCGDLAGFTAACYMRGIDFYNIPTTVLSQVDSSVGGKTAVDLNGIKNVVGAFYQPKKVLIDTTVLETLPERQINNGLVEALKMSLTSDPVLFDIFENEDIYDKLDDIIERSVMIKKSVVEKDEKELGLRKILNFGHTIGHGIESAGSSKGLLHGECVGTGMIPMVSPDIRKRLIPVLKKLNIPVTADLPADDIYDAVIHDKKSKGSLISTVRVNNIGSFEFKDSSYDEIKKLIEMIIR